MGIWTWCALWWLGNPSRDEQPAQTNAKGVAAMQHARLADQINRMPFETWLCASQSAEQIGVPDAEAERVLRAGRRSGMLTVRREDGTVKFMRVRRRPRATTRSSKKRT
ncbi:hypothetical protein EF903_05360 [Streptomyces sp. WAC05292]|uniref:hypothetical protein n=1 Tax=Streptomyces sp. WAC05292 TaxID=2487418 RepID=UPI000F749A65|nr:hypothetical protein [Streptomyces sp. WAC05292]RSS95069.1 hypothetical protein EF903_05360 [Streptomyces sp. WAC05292]